jgi:hypothetical protein
MREFFLIYRNDKKAQTGEKLRSFLHFLKVIFEKEIAKKKKLDDLLRYFILRLLCLISKFGKPEKHEKGCGFNSISRSFAKTKVLSAHAKCAPPFAFDFALS